MSSELAAPLPGLILAASVGLNAGLAALAQRVGWYDPAGLPLKIHRQPVPLIGGIALFILLAVVGGIIGRQAIWYPLAGAGALIAGLSDDVYWKRRSSASAAHVMPKLALQAGAAGTALIAAGAGGIRLFLPVPAAAALMLVAMNAFNLEDGLDGLCAGEAAISCLGFAVVLYRLGAYGDSLVAISLAAALTGFLFLNWHPAQVFLGDSGSHLLGMLIACFTLVTMRSLQGASQFALIRSVAGTALLTGLPLFDLVFVLFRRLFRHQHLFAGDRGHLYDILHQRGVPVPHTTLLLLVVQGLSVLSGILLTEGGNG